MLKYSLLFFSLSAANVLAAILSWSVISYGVALFLYCSFSFLVLALGYGGLGPGIFLKRADGLRPHLTWILFGPYLLLNAFSFWLYRVASKEPAFVAVGTNLFFGCRLTAFEARQALSRGWIGVLDLAPEFSEVPPFREVSRYYSLPVLDTLNPPLTTGLLPRRGEAPSTGLMGLCAGVLLKHPVESCGIPAICYLLLPDS